MLHKKVMAQSGFRTLDENELVAVSGGATEEEGRIIVHGFRGFTGGFGGGGGGRAGGNVGVTPASMADRIAAYEQRYGAIENIGDVDDREILVTGVVDDNGDGQLDEIVVIGITPETELVLRDRASSTYDSLVALGIVVTGGTSLSAGMSARLAPLLGEFQAGALSGILAAGISNFSRDYVEEQIYQGFVDAIANDFADDGVQNLSNVVDQQEFDRQLQDFTNWYDQIQERERQRDAWLNRD